MSAPRAKEPPLLVRLALRLLLPSEEAEFFLGDLEESQRRSWAREILGAAGLRLGPRGRHRGPPPSKRDTMRDTMLAGLLHDLRFGARTLLRTPGFTLVALLTMALGIGANTAIFSIVHGVILKPLSYPEPDRIVRVFESLPPMGFSTFSLSPLNLWDYQERNRSLDLLGAYQNTRVNYTGGDRPESLPALRVSEDYLEILGGVPTRGRGITRDDLDPGAPGVVIVSHGFWERALGGNPAILGTTMVLDDVPHTVVGVLPRGWEVPGGSRRDLVLPLRPAPYWFEARSSHFLHAYGRLGPGVTLERAQADLSSVAAALEAEYPESNTGWGAVVLGLEELMVGPVRPQLLIFMASVGLILLIACANLANMTLARGITRTRELAIRTAVGADRGRVVRQLLAESLLLAVLGGALGVALAYGALEALVTGWPTLLPRMGEIEVNGTVLLFSLGLSLAAGLLFGLLPAFNAAGASLSQALGQGSRSIAGDRSRRWMRTTLVTAEVGLAVVLLVGSGLLVRSFAALQGQDPGFATEDRLLVSISLSRLRYGTPQERLAFVEAALPRLQAIPGVERAALSTLIPMAGSDEVWGIWLEGQPAAESGTDNALFYRVTPGYLEAMGISLLAGRDVSEDDREGTTPVVVVSASFAERHFSGENPIGRRIRFGREEDSPHVEIVGVVEDVQHYVLGRVTRPQIYVPFRQRNTGFLTVVLKAAVPPLSLVGPVREAVASVDPDQPLLDVQPADALIESATATPRFRTLLMGGVGLTALLLAVVGLYGVMAYSVSQRTKEIGVRMALGASQGSVLGLVLREGAPLVGVGLAGGLASAFALSRVLESMLFGVGARDPAVFTTVPLVLVVVATAALLLPARRATLVDPARTLGEE